MFDYSKVIAVTNRHLCTRPLPDQVRRICLLQPRGIILREKDLPEEEYEELAARIFPICEQYQVPLTLHFYPEAARRLGVRRIHLPLWKLEALREEEGSAGSTDSGTSQEIAGAVDTWTHRQRPEVRGCRISSETSTGTGTGVGTGPISSGTETEVKAEILSYFDVIGTSVHAPAEAVRAQELGASYVTAGHVYTTDCKKGLPARGLTFLQEVCQAVTIPVCAIGGINRDPEKIQAVLACGADAACIMSGMMGELE